MTHLKVEAQKFQFRLLKMAYSFQICEIQRNSPKIPTYSSSKSSKMSTESSLCNFLLVNNSNYGRCGGDPVRICR